jgi:squalene synthase HpnC
VAGGIRSDELELIPGDLLAKAGAENFPVALRLLPRARRRPLMAAYWFARVTDDTGDTGPRPDRLRKLGELEADLARLPDGDAQRPEVRALRPLVTSCGVPVSLFTDLIRANRQDQVVSRYQNFDELLGYCELSANPVGRIVLHIFGASSASAERLSDRICTALQLIEHWQDVAEDYQAGRIYLPADDLREFGCAEADLAADQASPRLRELLGFESRRAGELLDSGAPLIGALRGAARVAVAGYVAGGRAALAALAGARYDVLAGPPRPRRGRMVREMLLALIRGR